MGDHDCLPRRNSAILRSACALLALVAASLAPKPSLADEGGVSMWVPGFFGSLAAAPQQPGWALATIYYHTSVDASGAAAVSRQITIGQFNPNVDVSVRAALAARPDLVLFAPTYTFATPVLGGQAQIVVLQSVGHIAPSLDATVAASLGPLSVVRSVSISDERWGFSDFGVQGNLRWNHGVHNFMTYAAVNAPTGTYDASRLANFGIGHWAIDAGGGYTYLNPQTGNEFSGVLGFTYNFENPSTDYQNGIDMHFDWAASHFLSKQFFVGVVGYAYQQLTPDRGQAAILGDFKSRVFGIGPQAGYLFPIGGMQGYLNLKGYREFEAENRPEGWNVWLTFSISPAAPTQTAAPRRHMITK
jgi:hypothetical protein